MNRSTKRFALFQELRGSISFLRTCMFPACCFCQRIDVVLGHMNGVLIEGNIHVCKNEINNS